MSPNQIKLIVTTIFIIALFSNLASATIDTNTFWASATGTDYVYRVNLLTGSKVQTVDLSAYGVGNGIAVGNDGNVWVVTTNSITAISTDSNAVVTNIPLGTGTYGIAIDSNNNAWVTNPDANTVSRIDLAKSTVTATIMVGWYPVGVAVSPDGNVWVTNYNDNTVSSINPITNSVDFNVTGLTTPQGIIVDSNRNVWVANAWAHSVSRINPNSQAITHTVNITANFTPWLTVGPDDYIYVSQHWSPYSGISKINPITYAISTYLLSSWEEGAGFSGDGFLWTVKRYTSNVVVKVNPNTMSSAGVTVSLDSGQDAYSYGDPTGWVLANIVSVNPIVSSDSNNNTWQNTDANIHLTCSSNSSTCSTIYYRLDTNSGTGVNYGNWNAYDTNITISSEGSYAIDFNASDIDGRESTNITEYILIDKSVPTVTADNNSAWQSNDANITLTCSDTFSGCSTTYYRIDSDSGSSVSYGNWQAYDTNILITGDGNYAIDYNASDNAGNYSSRGTIYVLIDSSTPTITISSPASGGTQTSASVTLEYSGSADSGISKYWLKVDSGEWIDNSTNTTYTFLNQSSGSHTYYVIATSNSDKNSSTSSATITINATDSTTTVYCGDGICNNNELCTTCPSDCGVCGTGGGYKYKTPLEVKYPKPVESKIETKEISYKKSYNLANSEGTPTIKIEQGKVRTMQEAAGELSIKREISIFTKLDRFDRKAGHTNIMELIVENLADRTIEGIEITEILPKNFVKKASQITSDTNFIVLEEDPIIRFTIEKLTPGKTARIEYQFDTTDEKAITEELFSTIEAPTIFFETNEKSCDTKICNDYDSCTTDHCKNGFCTYEPKCGENETCTNGECTAQKTGTGKIMAEPTKEESGATLILLSILLIAATLIIITKKIRK